MPPAYTWRDFTYEIWGTDLHPFPIFALRTARAEPCGARDLRTLPLYSTAFFPASFRPRCWSEILRFCQATTSLTASLYRRAVNLSATIKMTPPVLDRISCFKPLQQHGASRARILEPVLILAKTSRSFRPWPIASSQSALQLHQHRARPRSRES